MNSISNWLPTLAAEIRKAHADVQDAAKTAAERAIEAGHALIEAKTLVEHGQWLPWLREHCALAERTAQLYMKISKLGLESAMVADIGLNAAAKVITIAYPDPFADDPEEGLLEWSIWSLWLLRSGHHAAGVDHHMHWLRRNGWYSPSEYYGDDGDLYRKRVHLRPVPEGVKAEWFAYLAEHKNQPREKIEGELLVIVEGQPDLQLRPSPRRKRKRRSHEARPAKYVIQ